MCSWLRTWGRLWASKRMRCSFIRRPPGPEQKCIQVCTVAEMAKLISQAWVDLDLAIGWTKLRDNCRSRQHRLEPASVPARWFHRIGTRRDAGAPERFAVSFNYASGIVVRCSSGTGKFKGGATFEGEKGAIHVSRGVIESKPEELLTQPLDEDAEKLYASANHHQNWLDCIKSRKEPICNRPPVGDCLSFGQYRYSDRQEAPWKLPEG